MNQLYRFYSSDLAGQCPACGQALPTKGEVRSMTLQVRPAQTVFRDGRSIDIGGQTVDTRCFMRICQCGMALAVQPAEGGFCYSFRCRMCDCFSPNVSPSGWCLCCILQRSAGVNDARALIDSLAESTATMGRSRSEFLDGFLKGVILGVPGLVVPDAA